MYDLDGVELSSCLDPTQGRVFSAPARQICAMKSDIHIIWWVVVNIVPSWATFGNFRMRRSPNEVGYEHPAPKWWPSSVVTNCCAFSRGEPLHCSLVPNTQGTGLGRLQINL